MLYKMAVHPAGCESKIVTDGALEVAVREVVHRFSKGRSISKHSPRKRFRCPQNHSGHHCSGNNRRCPAAGTPIDRFRDSVDHLDTFAERTSFETLLISIRYRTVRMTFASPRNTRIVTYFKKGLLSEPLRSRTLRSTIWMPHCEFGDAVKLMVTLAPGWMTFSANLRSTLLGEHTFL